MNTGRYISVKKIMSFYNINPAISKYIYDLLFGVSIEKFRGWYNKSYKIVLWEFKQLYLILNTLKDFYKYDLYRSATIFELLRINRDNWRSYYINMHYSSLKKSFHKLKMELDRDYIARLNENELHEKYISVIVYSYRQTRFT